MLLLWIYRTTRRESRGSGATGVPLVKVHLPPRWRGFIIRARTITYHNRADATAWSIAIKQATSVEYWHERICGDGWCNRGGQWLPYALA